MSACLRPDCVHTARQLERFRIIAADLRRQFAEGHGVYEATAYLVRATEAEARLDVLGTRLALAERALRLLVAGKDAGRETAVWREFVRRMEEEAAA